MPEPSRGWALKVWRRARKQQVFLVGSKGLCSRQSHKTFTRLASAGVEPRVRAGAMEREIPGQLKIEILGSRQPSREKLKLSCTRLHTQIEMKHVGSGFYRVKWKFESRWFCVKKTEITKRHTEPRAIMLA